MSFCFGAGAFCRCQACGKGADFAAADGNDAKERGGKQGGKEYPHEIGLGLVGWGGGAMFLFYSLRKR